MVFAATNLPLNGSGFLTVYLAGIVISNSPPAHATEHVLRVMDGLAWLSPGGHVRRAGAAGDTSKMIDHAAEALAMAVFLMLVARPLAVAIRLPPLSAQRAPLRELGGPARRGAGGARSCRW